MLLWNRAKPGITGISLSVLLALAACAGASPEQKQRAADATPLSGDQLQSTLAGNTLAGKSSKGPTYVEFFDSTGHIRGKWAGKDKYVGTWSIKDGKLCYDYEGTDHDGCSVMSINGSNIYWLDDDGSAGNAGRPATLTQGNPNKL